MLVLGVISDLLLYLCFSVLIGTLILYFVPKEIRPEIHVSRKVLLISIIGIVILSFMQPLQLILAFYKDTGLSNTIHSVLFTFEVGKVWILTVAYSLIIFIYLIMFDIKKKASYSYIGLLITVGLIFAVCWGSHASSMVGYSGFLAHSFHFLAVCVWIGILFVAGWLSTNYNNWEKFLKWFTPIAILCVLTTFVTGLYLMKLVVGFDEYTNAWKLTYGQALLLKHIFIIPLLAFAFINSILIRRRLKNDITFNPIPWIKTESLVVLFIFTATSVLGNTAPPSDFETIFALEGPSKLFDFFYPGNITAEMGVFLSFGFNSISLLLVALFFISLSILAFIKKASSFLSFNLSVVSVLTLYLSLMLSIQ
ncbi:copper resistance D family protein [Bacillus sp. JJ1562]|uniref:copper resistance D family protein n=1 Tax=Bacillus sp. JJ1562 TaxID=3122960 RepID=UPI0030027284